MGATRPLEGSCDVNRRQNDGAESAGCGKARDAPMLEARCMIALSRDMIMREGLNERAGAAQ